MPGMLVSGLSARHQPRDQQGVIVISQRPQSPISVDRQAEQGDMSPKSMVLAKFNNGHKDGQGHVAKLMVTWT